jgi:hypothetical protein
MHESNPKRNARVRTAYLIRKLRLRVDVSLAASNRRKAESGVTTVAVLRWAIFPRHYIPVCDNAASLFVCFQRCQMRSAPKSIAGIILALGFVAAVIALLVIIVRLFVNWAFG